MTVTTRRVARRCRERFGTQDTGAAAADPVGQQDPPTTIEEPVQDGAPQENVDATQ